MFTKTLRSASVQINNSTVSLSKSLAPAILKEIRGANARKIGEVLKTCDTKAAYPTFIETLADYTAAEKVLKATRAELEHHADAITALKSGKLPPGQLHETVDAAASCFGLAQLIKQAEPDSLIATELYSDCLTSLQSTVEDLRETVATATDRLDKAALVLQKAAMAAFALTNANLGKMVEAKYHLHLPQRWQGDVLAAGPLGNATHNAKESNAANMNANRLQTKFRKTLAEEQAVLKDVRAKAKDRLARNKAIDALREATV